MTSPEASDISPSRVDWAGGWSAFIFRSAGPLRVGPPPGPQLGWFVRIRFKLSPNEERLAGLPRASDTTRVHQIADELREVAGRRCQMVACAWGKARADFFFYAESAQVLTDWRRYLVTFHPYERFTSNVSEDAVHKWYKVLRDEAE